MPHLPLGHGSKRKRPCAAGKAIIKSEKFRKFTARQARLVAMRMISNSTTTPAPMPMIIVRFLDT